jgi:hypothetical protein
MSYVYVSAVSLAGGVFLLYAYQKGLLKAWFDWAVVKVKGLFVKKEEVK